MANALTQEDRARALGLLRAAVDASNIKTVAERIGYARPTLSRLLNDDYPNGDEVLAAALAHLDGHRCPWLGADVTGHYCIELNTGPVPTWNPSALDQRRVCQRCPHKPVKDES
ncbi:MAG: hypothetical protein Q7U97_05580 [Rhodocyclaceae bacterium]|nr:hypothetical protein [Rhodocyclaceae bacterium]